METLAQDVRHALRGLMRTPAFTLVAVATLALGVGGTTAIYSIVDAAFLDPLPYPDAHELVVPYNAPAPDRGRGFAAFSAPFQLAIRDEGALSSVAALAPLAVGIGGVDRPERVAGARVSASFFDVAGVAPALGRGFADGEDRPGAAPVVVIGHDLWTRRFAADPAVVDRTLRVGDTPTTVVGVMPPGFELLLPGVELWLPLVVDEAALDRTAAVNNNRMLLARLPGGASLEQVEARLAGAVDRFRARFPDALTDDHAVHLVPLRRHLYGGARGSLLMLLGAVGLVLLIACANLANLLLVRAEARRQELAVRCALGAGRARILRELLTESLLLALAGGAAGATFASALLGLVRPLAPVDLPLPSATALDASVLLFTVAVSLATGALFGAAPAWSAARSDPRSVLGEGGRGGHAGRRGRARSTLVVAEVALTAVLLVACGLLVRSLVRLQAVDPGFGTDDRMAVELALPEGRYPDAPSMGAFYRRLVEELDALPGVAAVGLTQSLPLTPASNWGFEVDGIEDAGVGFADYTLVTPELPEALGMEVVRGRALTWADVEPEAQPVLMVSEATAKRLWPGGDPIGRRINIDLGPTVWREVVGVVSDVRNRSLADPPSDLLYFPPTDLPMTSPRAMTLVIHHPSSELPLTELRRIVSGLDPSIPVTRVRTLEAIASASEVRRRFMVTLLGLFAGLALALAAVGLYGVVSYTFSLRTREIGLRMAVGAGGREVVGLVLRQSGLLVGLGLVAGFAGAAAASRLLGGLLYDVGRTDPLTYAAVATFLGLVAGVATWAPARRAVRVDPASALRE